MTNENPPLPPEQLTTRAPQEIETPAMSLKLPAQKASPRFGKTAIGIIVILTLAVGYLTYDKIVNTPDSDIVASQQEEIDTLTAEAETAEADKAALEAEIVLKNNLLDAREGFIVVLADYNAEVNAASTSLDLSANNAVVDASRERVFAERNNSKNIDLEAKKVKAEMVTVKNAVLAYNAQVAIDAAAAAQAAAEKAEADAKAAEAAKAANAAAELKKNLTGTTAEQAMDEISGGTVNVVITDDACRSADSEKGEAAACVAAYDPLTVNVVTKFANDPTYDANSWRMVMMHEYGHVIQFSNYQAFEASEGFTRVFNSDYEWYADCMAASVIGSTYVSGYGYTCTPEQLNIGTEAFKKNFL